MLTYYAFPDIHWQKIRTARDPTADTGCWRPVHEHAAPRSNAVQANRKQPLRRHAHARRQVSNGRALPHTVPKAAASSALLFTGHVEEGELSAITRGRTWSGQLRLLATKPLRRHNDAL